MTLEFNTVEDITSALVDMTNAENQSIFAQGDILAVAVEQGYEWQTIKGKCAEATGRSTRTLYERLHVAQTFAPEKRNPTLSWAHHQLASRTDNPHEWLARAADEHLSTRQLKTAIELAGGNPNAAKPVYLLTDAETVIQCWRGNELVLVFNAPVEFPTSAYGTPVLITLVQAPAETEAA